MGRASAAYKIVLVFRTISYISQTIESESMILGYLNHRIQESGMLPTNTQPPKI